MWWSFMNAINLMMKIDNIMPKKKTMASSISKIAFVLNSTIVLFIYINRSANL